MERPELLAEARRAFERGRRRLAMRTALISVPMAALSLFWNRDLRIAAPLALALVLVSATLAWRGGVAGRAVTPGLLAGLPPMLLPLLTDASCTMIGALAVRLCFVSCIVGGLLGGAMLWRWASRVEKGRTEFVLVGGAIASVAGSLGCVVLGFSGVLAMVGALAVLSAPAALVPARST